MTPSALPSLFGSIAGSPVAPSESGARAREESPGRQTFALILSEAGAVQTRDGTSDALLSTRADRGDGSEAADLRDQVLKLSIGFDPGRQPPVSDNGRRFSNETRIGDSAISFAARPMVAPSAFRYGRDSFVDGELTVSALRIAEHLVRGEADRFARAMPGLSGHMLSPASPQLSMPAAGAIASLPYQLPAATGLATVRPAPMSPIALQIGATVSSPVRSGPEGAAQATLRPQPVQSFQPVMPAFAQLLATPSEYRLVIRGQKLSENEREHLMREIHTSLSALGLPFHPVRLIETGGER